MMVKARYLLFLPALLCGIAICSAQQGPDGEQDPPTRAARLSYYNGSVSMEPAGIDDWAPVEVNRPFTTGDYLYTDQKSIAELELDSAVFRMGEVTSFGFLNLNDQIVQLKLTEGDIYFRVHDLAPGQVYEVDTPNAAITLQRDGVYRIHVNPEANTTFVVVREGQAEINGGAEAFTLNPAQSANLSGTSQLGYDIEGAPGPDALDQWCLERDQRAMQPSETQYVPPSMIGYPDLNQNGAWTETPDYGPLWYPTHVDAGWAPYHVGHWVWIDPWGWTWVDAEPWGFAPSHYGRWVYWHDRWGWAPGPIAVRYGRPYRPVYAPALVAWFGGAHWGVSIGIGGGGPALGWVPLGFGEIYTPAYHCGPSYFRNVNVYNTRVVNEVNITNVYRTVYVQRGVYNQNYMNVRAPRGAVAMSASAMASGRAVQEAGRPVQANAMGEFRGAAMVSPGVVPTRNGVAPLMGRPAPHPNQAVFARSIVAHVAQPQAVVPFAQRQAFVQQHAGEPVNFAAMRQQYQGQARPVAVARVEQPSRPAMQVHAGERVGNVPPNNARPAEQTRYAQQAPAAQHGVAETPTAHGVPPNRPGYNGATRQNTSEQQGRYQQGRTENGGQQPRYQQQPQRTNNAPAAAQPRYEQPQEGNNTRPTEHPNGQPERTPQYERVPQHEPAGVPSGQSHSVQQHEPAAQAEPRQAAPHEEHHSESHSGSDHKESKKDEKK